MVPGHKMCCICFEYISLDDLWVDIDGQKYDMCRPCVGAYDVLAGLLVNAGYTNEQIIQTFKDLTTRFQADSIEP